MEEAYALDRYSRDEFCFYHENKICLALSWCTKILRQYPTLEAFFPKYKG